MDMSRKTLDAYVDGTWANLKVVNNACIPEMMDHKHTEVLRVPNMKYFTIQEQDPEQQVLAEASFAREKHCDKYGIIGKYESLGGSTGEWFTIGKVELELFYDLISHINVKLASLERLEVKFEMEDIKSWMKELEDWRMNADARDSPFGQLPRAQWLKTTYKNDDGKTLKKDLNKTKWIQHRHSNAMAAFENHTKKLISPFEVRIKVHPPTSKDVSPEKHFVTTVQYLINHKALGHKAAAHLPPTTNPAAEVTAYARVERNAVLSENMRVDSSRSEKHSFIPFRESLTRLSKSPLSEDTMAELLVTLESFKADLSQNQSLSLEWMFWREMNMPEFIEREIEEEIIPDLKLRLLGCAERRARHPGGILADDVGYGKTVITLALIHCQKEFDDGESKRLRAAKNPHHIHLKATLILVPPHLVDQWAKEAVRFLHVKSHEVVKINTSSDLQETANRNTLKKFKAAKLIIVNSQSFAKYSYFQNLAKLSGSLNPPCDEQSDRGNLTFQNRAFEEWYKEAAPIAGEVAGRLLENETGLDIKGLYSEIRQRQDRCKRVYEEFKQNYESVSGSAELLDQGVPSEIPAINSGDFSHVLEAFTFARIVYDEFSYEQSLSTMFIANSQAYSKWILSGTPPAKDLSAVCYTAKHFNVHIARPIYRRQGMPRITRGPEIEDMSNAERLHMLKFLSDQTIRERHQQGIEFLEHFATSNPLDQNLSGGVVVEEKVIVCEMSPYELLHYHDLEQDLRACNFDANLLPKESRTLLQPVFGSEWGANGKELGTTALIFRSSHGNWHQEEYSISCLFEQRRAVRQKAIHAFRITADKAIWLSRRICESMTERGYQNGVSASIDIYMLLKGIWEKRVSDCGGFDAWSEFSRAIVTRGEKISHDEMVEAVQDKRADFLMDKERFFDAVGELTSNTWVDYYDLKAGDLEGMSEREMVSLLRDLRRAHNFEGDISTDSKVGETLERYIKGGLKNYRQPKQRIESLEIKFTISNKTPRRDLEGLCRAVGIYFQPSTLKKDLKALLDSHIKGELDESSYGPEVKSDPMKVERYPSLGAVVRIRGGKYTLTGNDASNTSINLRKAFENVIYAIKQERIVNNLTTNEKEMQCYRCARIVPREDLHMVCQCGHLLCTTDLNSDYCGGGDSERCLSSLKGATIPMKNINKPQRRLELGAGTQKDAPSVKISAKFQMLANTIMAIPADEFGLVFFQFDSQLEELQFTLRKNGIGFAYISPNGKKATHKMDDKMRSIDGVKDLDGLRDRCDERALLWSEEETNEELQAKLKRWRARAGDGEHHPKIRILRINDVTSAGSNFQYANHVMFVTPLAVDLQTNYDAWMKQAKGRCVRYGQKKNVQVYHFVTAGTIEVDILELRTRSHVLVPPGKAVGRLQPAPLEEDKMGGYADINTSEDTIMTDAPENSQAGISNNPDLEERVKSNLTQREIWKAMNEQNWLTTVGIEY
ncbi:SNF2 family N-terminal domain-containing protein [Daldinia sp. FL1419]|nr:SNF2 family N-terminal domain-containing protein [Daldinia sp. FL1419]